jgi:hypothetical protein
VSNAIAGPGFLLQCKIASVWTTIAEVKDISGPEASVDVVDVTNQSSPDNFEEIIPTLKHGGTTSFDVHFVPDDVTLGSDTGIMSFLFDRSKQEWQILVGPTDSVQFEGYVVKMGMKFPVANVATASVDIRVTGPVVIAAALV